MSKRIKVIMGAPVSKLTIEEKNKITATSWVSSGVDMLFSVDWAIKANKDLYIEEA